VRVRASDWIEGDECLTSQTLLCMCPHIAMYLCPHTTICMSLGSADVL
jgi:hypothetical protein